MQFLTNEDFAYASKSISMFTFLAFLPFLGEELWLSFHAIKNGRRHRMI